MVNLSLGCKIPCTCLNFNVHHCVPVVCFSPNAHQTDENKQKVHEDIEVVPAETMLELCKICYV